MEKILIYISDYSIPLIIFYIVIMGLYNNVNVFEEFMVGAKQGIKIVIDIMPTLLGLMVSIGVMRRAGIFEIISEFIEPLTNAIRIPSVLVPLVIVKMFSSSAATSMLIDIYKEYGTDSYEGILSSVIMSASETVFYVLAVYTAAGKIRKTRYTILGGLFATIVGIICSIIVVNL